MIKIYLSFILCCLLLMTTNASFISAQTTVNNNDSTVSKIKAKILKRGTGESKRVKIKMANGTKLKGYISQSGEDSFTLTDSKTRQTTVIPYADVAKLGGLSKGEKIGIGVALGATAVAAIVLLRFLSIYCNNEGC